MVHCGTLWYTEVHCGTLRYTVVHCSILFVKDWEGGGARYSDFKVGGGGYNCKNVCLEWILNFSPSKLYILDHSVHIEKFQKKKNSVYKKCFCCTGRGGGLESFFKDFFAFPQLKCRLRSPLRKNLPSPPPFLCLQTCTFLCNLSCGQATPCPELR